jgi:hypothetical protein
MKGFGSSALRKLLEPKQKDVSGDWRKVDNSEFHDVYTS